jgi:hypothetical protein
MPATVSAATAVKPALLDADQFVAVHTASAPRSVAVMPQQTTDFSVGRFQQQALNSTETTNPPLDERPMPSTSVQVALSTPSENLIETSSASTESTKKTTKQVMDAAITTLNTGLFLQNVASVAGSGFLSLTPNSFNVMGSTANLISLFVPKNMQLPLFVMGLSMNMGGWALASSQMLRIDSSRLDNTMPAYREAMDPHWKESFEHFPHPGYQPKNKPGYSTAHLFHPGLLSELARNQYDEARAKVSNVLFDKLKLPKKFLPFLPDIAAGSYQIAWMNWKMLTNLGFAYDALRPMARSEHTRGSKFLLPNSPPYVLALATMLPLVLMGSALVVEGMQNAKKGIEKKFDPTKPISVENQQDLGSQQASDATAINEEKSQAPVFQKAKPLQLAANISAMLPPLANLMFVPMMEVAGSGNPVNIAVKGSNFFYKITPHLDARLVKYGSIGAIGAALASTASGLGWLPKVFSDTADLAFLAFSGVSSVGLSRNTFSESTKVIATERWFPTPDQHQNMTDAIRHRLYWAAQPNWLRTLANAFGVLPHEAQTPSAGAVVSSK